jgi:hypothetical protein
MSDQYCYLQEKLVVAANAAEELELHVPLPGNWLIESCWVGVHTTSSLHATNYATITVKKGAGGTAIGSITTETVALTKGTARQIPITTSPANNVIAGQSSAIELAVTQAASGVAVDCTVFLVLRKLVS